MTQTLWLNAHGHLWPPTLAQICYKLRTGGPQVPSHVYMPSQNGPLMGDHSQYSANKQASVKLAGKCQSFSRFENAAVSHLFGRRTLIGCFPRWLKLMANPPYANTPLSCWFSNRRCVWECVCVCCGEQLRQECGAGRLKSAVQRRSDIVGVGGYDQNVINPHDDWSA